MITFGSNLKNLRKFNKMSQNDFARKINTSQQRVSRWECDSAEPALYDIMKIIDVFDTSFEELTEGINKE